MPVIGLYSGSNPSGIGACDRMRHWGCLRYLPAHIILVAVLRFEEWTTMVEKGRGHGQGQGQGQGTELGGVWLSRQRVFIILALPLIMVATTCGAPQEVPPEPVAPIEPPPPSSDLQLLVVTIDGEQFLRHPDLGFLLSHPGDQFQWSEEVEGRICTSMQTELTVECHALVDSSTGTIFTVQVNQVPSATPQDFPEFHAGLVDGLGEEMVIAEQGIDTDGEGRMFSRILALANGPGVSVFAQTHPLIDEVSGYHYAISVFVYGSDPEGMRTLGITYHLP